MGKRSIRSRYSIASLLLLLAISFYIACRQEGDQPSQDVIIEKKNEHKPERKRDRDRELRYLTSFEGKVIGIKDGDTFEILVEGQPEKVRLADIDCPERQQPFGNNAKQYASELCFGKTVKVRSTGKRDRYKRVVGVVTTPEGLNVNKEMLRAGFAWHYKYHSQNDTLDFLEDKAREQELGLWQDQNPIAPWDWRKQMRNK